MAKNNIKSLHLKMKNLFFLLLLLCTLNSYGQAETKEDFVNEVYCAKVNKSYRYYYLDSNASAINWHYEKSELMKKIALYDSIKNPDKSELWESMARTVSALYDSTIRQVPGSVLEELYDKANSDTVKEQWDFSLLNKARIVSPEVLYNIKMPAHKHHRTKEQKNIFSFSRPIFSKSKEYAIISMESYCGSLCAERCIYLFRKITGKWKDIVHLKCMDS
jgi:hypothetical protein